MVRIGLTGGIASGKTAVSNLLARYGAVIIDADLLAREVVEPGTEGLAAIVQRFGEQLLVDGVLNRAELGKIVFADPGARRDLEQIIHPAVRRRAAELEQQADPSAVVVHVIPLLVETGQQTSFDRIIVVDVQPETQLARLVGRGGLTENEAKARIGAQATRDERLAVADLVIDNFTTMADLESSVAHLWRQLAAQRD